MFYFPFLLLQYFLLGLFRFIEMSRVQPRRIAINYNFSLYHVPSCGALQLSPFLLYILFSSPNILVYKRHFSVMPVCFPYRCFFFFIKSNNVLSVFIDICLPIPKNILYVTGPNNFLLFRLCSYLAFLFLLNIIFLTIFSTILPL